MLPKYLSKESIWIVFKFAFTITGYVDFGQTNLYLRDEGGGFNSTSGAFASSDEGLLSSCKDPTLARVGGIGGEGSRS